MLFSVDEQLCMLLQEKVESIADSLIERAIKTDDGFFWEGIHSVFQDGVETASITKQTNIYAGAAGILLFFDDLHCYTGDEKYRAPLRQGARGLINDLLLGKVESNSFIAGKLGVAYCLARIGKSLDEPLFINEAISLCLSQSNYFLQESDKFEYLDGLSGSIWVLVFLHSISQNEDLLPLIDKAVGKLVRQAKLSRSGIFFDQIINATKPLCGFSHGPSGVAHLFLELYRYFNNHTFAELASLCFAYEDQYYNYNYEEWPDFRRLEGQSVIRRKYIEQDSEYFSRANYVTAWCHGGVGIVLPRLYALELGEAVDLSKVISFLEKNLQMRVDIDHTFTLCHGNCGLAETYLEAARVTGRTDFLEHAQRIYVASFQHFQHHNKFLSGYIYSSEEDNSLFMGLAGIGHSMLRCLTSLQVSSILAPRVCGTFRGDIQPFDNLTFTTADIWIQLLTFKYKSWFKYAPPELQDDFLATLRKLDPPLNTINDVNPPWDNTSGEERIHLHNAIILDHARFKAFNNMNIALNYAKYYVFKSRVATYRSFSVAEIIEIDLVVNPASKLVSLDKFLPHSDRSMAHSHVVLVPRILDLEEFPIANHEYLVYSKFRTASSIRSVLNSLTAEGLADLGIQVENIHQWCLNVILDQVQKHILLEKSLVTFT